MKNRLLILILQNIVLFPNQEVKLEFSNDISKNIIDRAIHQNGAELVLVASKNEEGNVFGVEDIESIGVLVKIKNAIDLPNGKLRVALRGTKRLFYIEFQRCGDHIGKFTQVGHIFDDIQMN